MIVTENLMNNISNKCLSEYKYVSSNNVSAFYLGTPC